MSPATFTIAGQADIRQRLNSDGLGGLGLAGPLLSPAWTVALPTANVANLRFTVASQWYAPIAGMLITEPTLRGLGLSRFDGTPWPAGPNNAVVFRIHPQARVRLERLMTAALQAPGTTPADRSIRPVPAVLLITNPVMTFATPWRALAGDQFMPAGDVSMYDEHGLTVDPFAFAAAIAGIFNAFPAAFAPMPSGAPAGTPAAVAGLAPAGNWVHAVDLHGRPWQDPPVLGQGVSLFSGAAGARVLAQDVPDGLLHGWNSGDVFAAEADPNGVQNATTTPALVRFGWHTVGRMGTVPLAWPAAGPQVPVRDTMRMAVCDPVFHLVGNRTGTLRDSVLRADGLTVAEQAPIVREGSPVTLFADGRSALGWIGQVILGLQGGNPAAPFTSGPMFAASPFFDDGAWPFPSAPGPTGAWPIAPSATPVPGNAATVLGQLAPLRTAGTASWIAGTNDVLVQFPAGLPAGVAVRLYPIQLLMNASPDEQPLLRRGDGDAIVTTGGPADRLRLRDPFGLGPAAARPGGATDLRMDAAVAWLSGPGAVPQVKILANLQ